MPGPLIPIKHSDGTIEKITLEEFKARQKKNAPKVSALASAPKPLPSTVKPIEPKVKTPPSAPVVIKSEEKIPETKVAQKPIVSAVPAPLSSVAKSEEGRSLLEEELPATKQAMPKVSLDRKEEAEAIVSRLNFSLSDEARKRLIGLVQLRLKDIRGEYEVRDWLTRPDNQMGINLTEDQAENVLKMIREHLEQPVNAVTATPLKRPLGTPTSLIKEDKEPLPATSTPINPFVHASHQPTNDFSKPPKSLDELVKKEADAAAHQDIDSLLMPKEQPARSVVRDISPGKPVSLGPVDELRYITLTDFRRLSANPEEAAARLKQKFINLKEESYILYMNGLSAWRQSPLFMNYTDAAISALNVRTKMGIDASDKEKIQMSEIQALVAMQKQLI